MLLADGYSCIFRYIVISYSILGSKQPNYNRIRYYLKNTYAISSSSSKN